MQSSRDSSVWRTLAVAFGDGLAFGVGVTLTRGAARLAANRSITAQPHADNGWSSATERRAESADPAPPPIPAGPVHSVIERRIAQTGGQIDRRLAELETRIQTELDALDAQDHELAEGVEVRIEGIRSELAAAVAAQRQSIDADMLNLRAQMSAIHKEFAETLARLVDEQIAKTIATRLQGVEEELRETIRAEVRLAGQGRQFAELREIMEHQERNVHNLVTALGQNCLQAADRIAPAQPAPDPVAPPAANRGLPGFAQPRPRKSLWRVPIVPSFVAATGSLLLLHYL